jgi:hypothetical protein
VSPVIDLLFLGNAFFVGSEELSIETIELFVHEHFGLIWEVGEAIIVYFHCKFILE